MEYFYFETERRAKHGKMLSDYIIIPLDYNFVRIYNKAKSTALKTVTLQWLNIIKSYFSHHSPR